MQLLIKGSVMDSPLRNLSASALRDLVIHEMRKFTFALQLGATLSDLEEIRERIKELTDALSIKEQEEIKKPAVEIFPQSDKAQLNL